MVKQLIIFLALSFSVVCCAVVPPEPQPIVESGNATLNWPHVTQRKNGDDLALNQISHYEIFYGLESDTGPATMINVGKVETYTIFDLGAGKWQVWNWAVDIDGVTSELSNEANVTIVTQSRPVVTGLEVN